MLKSTARTAFVALRMPTPDEHESLSFGLFDPKGPGVQNLRRRLSTRSEDNGSDVTATGDDFNLDKVLRELLKRYVEFVDVQILADFGQTGGRWYQDAPIGYRVSGSACCRSRCIHVVSVDGSIGIRPQNFTTVYPEHPTPSCTQPLAWI